MKKLLGILVLGLLWCNVGFAENFIYRCNFDTQYKNKDAIEWKNKNISFTFKSINNETISIYDHEIKVTYSGKLDIILENTQLVAMYSDTSMIKTLVIDKLNSYGTYSISYIDGGAHGQYGIGKCILQ